MHDVMKEFCELVEDSYPCRFLWRWVGENGGKDTPYH